MTIAAKDKRFGFDELWQHCKGACGLVKDLDAFAVSYCNRLGRSLICKQCFNEKHGNPEGSKFRQAMSKAKRDYKKVREWLRTN